MTNFTRRTALTLTAGTTLSMAAPGLLRAAAPIRLGATPTAILVWLADGMGLFREGGPPVEIVRYASGTKTAKDLVAGTLDLATSSEFAFVSVAFDRPDLRILASLSRSRTIGVFARADRGIAGYADLDGKTVGVVKNSFTHFALHNVLLESGATPAEIRGMRPKEIVQAMVEGTIDAGTVWEPFLRQVSIALGDQFVLLPRHETHSYEMVLHGAEGWIEANRPAADAIVARLVEAARFAAEDPEAAKKIVGKRLELDAETMDYLWPKHTLKLTLSQSLLRLMEDEAWFRIDLGLSDGEVPNYLDLIAADALNAADPAGISIIGLN
ncbi:MAG: ABC transporter substrate-binding protein [Pseudomonadota bacterium]